MFKSMWPRSTPGAVVPHFLDEVSTADRASVGTEEWVARYQEDW